MAQARGSNGRFASSGVAGRKRTHLANQIRSVRRVSRAFGQKLTRAQTVSAAKQNVAVQRGAAAKIVRASRAEVRAGRQPIKHTKWW